MNGTHWTSGFIGFILQIVLQQHNSSNNLPCTLRSNNEEFLSCGDIGTIFKQNSGIIKCKNGADISGLNFSLNLFYQDSNPKLQSLTIGGCQIGNLDNIYNTLVPRKTDIPENIPFDSIRADVSKIDNFENLQGWKTLTITSAANVTIQSNALNNLTSLHFLLIQNIENLHLSKMQLPNLKRLKIMNNKFVSFPNDFFTGMPQLELLSLRNNSLSSLNGGIFQDLANLRRLDINNNKLENLPNNLFSGLRKLKILHLEHNKLKTLLGTIFNGLPNLGILYLNHNKIENLPNNLFNQRRKLNDLYLGHNKLTTVDGTVFEDMTNLQTLELSHNEIENLSDNSFTGLRALESLFLDNNKLKTLSSTIFRHSSHLRDLDLDSNELAELPRDIFDNICLRKLYINRNRFSQHPFRYLKLNERCSSILVIESYDNPYSEQH